MVDQVISTPLAYFSDFRLESPMKNEGGPRFGDHGYCWPEVVEHTRAGLCESDDPAYGEVIFMPIWTTPSDLTGAPREPSNRHIEGGADDE